MLRSALVLAVLAVSLAAFTHEKDASPAPDSASHAPEDLVAAGNNAPEAVAVAWQRPAGPLRVALQAGHWKAAEAPDEQAGLRSNGTRGGGKAEWEVNLAIAERTAALLRDAGYEVDILPTTIPPGYLADLFISIHADGNPSPSASGFRAAAPRRDGTGRAQAFVDILEEQYREATGLTRYPTVTRRMVNYYAFNSRRYQHALHPMTVGAILETGFLTSPNDRRVIVNAPDRAAQGIAKAVTLFLETTRHEPRTIAAPRPAPVPRNAALPRTAAD